MVMEANTPPEFTLNTDSDHLDVPSEQVVVSHHDLLGRKVVLARIHRFLPVECR
jgi:hypothetical protein